MLNIQRLPVESVGKEGSTTHYVSADRRQLAFVCGEGQHGDRGCCQKEGMREIYYAVIDKP